ncbi:hypothetical protein FKW77_009110 [Venturia effusa]|uniref:Heat shock 70 kDa protein 12A n=1 Tax=Venturia effusa TaxID=50376 RepID=A0A517LBK7_9PEZI|nr:hypothetical protein FKW77_009110 [Venturia effusa]
MKARAMRQPCVLHVARFACMHGQLAVQDFEIAKDPQALNEAACFGWEVCHVAICSACGKCLVPCCIVAIRLGTIYGRLATKDDNIVIHGRLNPGPPFTFHISLLTIFETVMTCLMESTTNTSQIAELPASTPSLRNATHPSQPSSNIQSQNSFPRSSQSLHRSQPSFHSSIDDPIDIDDEESRLVIGIDFGTTYTGVAYATPSNNVAILGDIAVVTYWGPQMGNSDKNAVAMITTKLELDIGTVSEELDILSSTLNGMKDLDFKYVKAAAGMPAFPCKGPEDIVTDYLTHVFEYLVQTVDSFSYEVRERFPVDIVVTCPTDWSYPAINSTYRALTQAGFNKDQFARLNEVLLVTEPEAAAVYTARYLSDFHGQDFLKVGECFVLCDAGGETVDVVSYRVKQLQPLELEKIGKATGRKCGSTYIDLAFKSWLLQLLGVHNYEKLDPEFDGKISSHATEGEAMRKVMKQFNERKEKFKKDSRDTRIDLPAPLDTLNLDTRIQGGGVSTSKETMKSFFDKCVDQVVELIKGHVGQIERPPVKSRSVFLVGGFGESPYLQQEVEFSLEKVRKITLRVPDTSWTAVVRGAVVMGVEKDRSMNRTTMTGCDKNYGVRTATAFSLVHNDRNDYSVDPVSKQPIARGQMRWLFRKGDAVLSNLPREEHHTFLVQFKEGDEKKGGIPVYSYPDEDIPDIFMDDPGIARVCVLPYNLASIPLNEFESYQAEKKGPRTFYAFLKLDFIMDRSTLKMILKFKNQVLDDAELNVGIADVDMGKQAYL